MQCPGEEFALFGVGRRRQLDICCRIHCSIGVLNRTEYRKEQDSRM
jgi:hypothetical protein